MRSWGYRRVRAQAISRAPTGASPRNSSRRQQARSQSGLALRRAECRLRDRRRRQEAQGVRCRRDRRRGQAALPRLRGLRRAAGRGRFPSRWSRRRRRHSRTSPSGRTGSNVRVAAAPAPAASRISCAACSVALRAAAPAAHGRLWHAIGADVFGAPPTGQDLLASLTISLPEAARAPRRACICRPARMSRCASPPVRPTANRSASKARAGRSPSATPATR